jgi:hypothetical protein
MFQLLKKLHLLLSIVRLFEFADIFLSTLSNLFSYLLMNSFHRGCGLLVRNQLRAFALVMSVMWQI